MPKVKHWESIAGYSQPIPVHPLHLRCSCELLRHLSPCCPRNSPAFPIISRHGREKRKREPRSKHGPTSCLFYDSVGIHLKLPSVIIYSPDAPDLPREQGDDETTDDVPHIQCGDGCDPQGLRDNSQFCLQRIHQGLVFYEKLLGSDIFTGEPSLLPDSPVGQLHASLLGLRQLLQPDGQHWETEQTPNPSPNQPWQRLLLRFKILRSLQAFVAVAARVFAHGAATLSP
ncbi:interleukin-23 subunit alpha isoform X1 [Neofelis nebulosa]|uniref:interleukin-23 subunit alpha isoform X1 n=1 Tax=Neofelis nebulosa TaxID=61452 RepID=UPI00272D5A98|nr:interleukin-23 subunit alpha isoform X1 [Neofelis nebulosa]